MKTFGRRDCLKIGALGASALFLPRSLRAEAASQGATAIVVPRVGAIRWDAWHGERGMPGRAVQHALGPSQWRCRLPFFAEVIDDQHVRIDGSSQDVMDQEIRHAVAAGLDYWAFVTYAADDPMSLGLARYLASSEPRRPQFCLITECGRWRERAFVDRLAGLMRAPTYLKVLAGRPVLYLGFIDDKKIQSGWGSIEGFRRTVDECRAAVRQAGLADPYLVIMDFNPVKGRAWMDALGAEALSSYVAAGKGQAAPYAELAATAEGFWDRCKDTGAQVVPIVVSGWDRRPRAARPVPWETWQKPGEGMDRYYQAPTPEELAAHLGRALDWLKVHRASAAAQLAIIYAWNENDEGGWLVPTLAEGSARLDAIAKALATGRT